MIFLGFEALDIDLVAVTGSRHAKNCFDKKKWEFRLFHLLRTISNAAKLTRNCIRMQKSSKLRSGVSRQTQLKQSFIETTL
jgi:hypothetical protein